MRFSILQGVLTQSRRYGQMGARSSVKCAMISRHRLRGADMDNDVVFDVDSVSRRLPGSCTVLDLALCLVDVVGALCLSWD